MSGMDTDSVDASSFEKGSADRPYGPTSGGGSTSNSSTAHGSPPKPSHPQSVTASTHSSHALSRHSEPSMTATGRSFSPLDTPPPTRRMPEETQQRSVSDRHAASAPPVASAPSAALDVRDTVEYRAAWDVELWKAVQADRFRKQLERQKTAAMADLARTVKRREREAAAALTLRAEAVAKREEDLKSSEAHLAARQSKAAEVERDIRRMRQQLLDAQQRVEDEVRAQVRLANDTIAHRARLLEERVKAAEAQAQRAEERQRQAQQEYLSLYEAFTRYRTQQLTSSANTSIATHHAIPAVSSIDAASSFSPAFQLEQLRAQWEAEHQLQLSRQEQRHTSELAAVQARCAELEGQNQRLTAALARRREQLRRWKGGGLEAKAAATAATTPSPPQPPAEKGNETMIEPNGRAALPEALVASAREDGARIERELRRLALDRVSLVDGSRGALRESDAVILRMDARMRELQMQLAALTGGRGADANVQDISFMRMAAA